MTAPVRAAHTVATTDPAEPEADLARSGPAPHRPCARPDLAALAPAGVDELLAVVEPIRPNRSRAVTPLGSTSACVATPASATGPQRGAAGSRWCRTMVDIPAGAWGRMGIDLDEVDRVVARVGPRSGWSASWILKEAPRHDRG